MDNFDLGNIGALLGGMQQRVQEMKAKQAELRCTGSAGDDMVTITLTGDFQVDAVQISEGAMEDRELLEDLVRAALSEALRNVQGELAKGMQEVTGGLPIPPGLLPL